ncbi:hypothetical protein [Staphylococcus capitis]|jgi:hypothetical protein|uniref:hypothetical protein n=1 Tax=Staphylococcus capitis TaxID=29388 RepID=UPI0011A4C99E|nr:MAG TPA: hypothetical protein [Caudoviricetes sp.]
MSNMLNSIDELVEWTIYICTKRKYLETRLDKIKTLRIYKGYSYKQMGITFKYKKADESIHHQMSIFDII